MSEPWTFSASGDVAERWDWLTDVLPPPTGEEQRRRLRQTPRIMQQFESLESAGRRRWMETLLVANGAGTWDVPLVQDASPLTAAAGEDDTSISVDTTFRRFAVDGRALLLGEDSQVYDVRTISAVASGSLTFTAGLDNAWPAGTRVIPLFEGRLPSMPNLERFTSDIVPVRLEFEISAPVDWPEDAGDAAYRSLPVLELAPDWSTDPRFTPERSTAVVDNETSIPEVLDQPGIPLSQYQMMFTFVGRAEITALWSLLYALAGRWGVIWVPSRALDLIVTDSLTSAGTTIDVERCGMSDWPLRANRRDIRIELSDGTLLYRRITDVDLVGETTERLTLDSALGVDADVDEVVLVSFMALCRQDTDTNLLRWWRDDVVLCELTFRGVLYDL